MIAYIILGVALVAGIALLLRWFIGSDPKRVVAVLRWGLAGIGVVLALLMLWGGARHLAAIALPFLLPLLLRSRWLLDRWKAARGPAPGQASTLETRYLRMTLDHDSGAMSGTVREGRFRGRRLDELSEDELLELWRECRTEDDQSATVLEAWLDRVHGDAWRQAAGAGAGAGGAASAGGAMTREEARQILGVADTATEAEIRAAHRKLMQQVHPDHGGSNYLAAKINQAKQVLLGG